MTDASFPEKLKIRLRQRAASGLLRTLKQDEALIDFCSNDYLGFARDMRIHHEAIDTFSKSSSPLNGATGSRLIRGNSRLAQELEVWLANFHHAESALLFNSGYDANLGFFSAVPQRDDTILYDRLIHASVHDGMRLSHARSVAFKHNDVNDLRRLMEKASGQVYIVVESLYSMDGDRAPLAELAALCKETGALLVVDEAHATGIFGPQGAGLSVDEAILPYCIARIYTFGKALGSHGAVVVGSSYLHDYLVNFARSFIYSTALPPFELHTIRSAYSRLLSSNEPQLQLLETIQVFRSCVDAHPNIRFLPADGPIQGVLIPGNSKALHAAAFLQSNGMDVRAILSPTVPEGMERLRICLHSFNTPDDVRKLFELLETIPTV
jgi:8-amino-7-oxononanoate synthase